MARILVAEDQRETRELYAEWLRGLGHDVLEASNGSEAMEQIRQSGPSVVVLDLQLPLVAGYDVLRTIRETPALAATSVVVVSGTATGKWSLREGADAFLQKPVSFEDLADAIRRVTH